jgi:hypothetical protein
MTDFKVGAYTYRAGKMDLFVQTGVITKILPLLAAFKDADVMQEIARSAIEGDDKRPIIFKMMGLMEPVAKALANLEDKDRNYIMTSCLAVCSRCEGDPQVGKPFAPIWNKSANVVMFEDITFPVAAAIIANVLKEQLTDFLSVFPSVLGGGETLQ